MATPNPQITGANASGDKPKRERKPKATTVIGTLNKMQNMLSVHSATERARILEFLAETNK